MSENEAIDLMDTFPAGPDRIIYDALVKLKLVHAFGRSVLIPDQLVLETEGVWLQPYFLTAPILSFAKGTAYAQFGIDLPNGEGLLVGLTNDRHLRALPDGSHIYRCGIAGPPALAGHATGACRLRLDSGFDMRLFHHTAPDTLKLIRQSSVLRGSTWNYQGTTKLKNISYAYLTSLDAIVTAEDLQKIAMASDGIINMLLDDHTPPDGVVPIKVYRESTLNRTATLPLWIPSDALAPSHVWKHAPSNEPVYYEIANPAIFRIGLNPGGSVPIVGDSIDIDEATLKRFEYVVIGDSTNPVAITAPFNEEDTRLVFKIEDCAGSDPLTFWQENVNTDLFSGRNVELQEFDRP